jgi:hypothetical protein
MEVTLQMHNTLKKNNWKNAEQDSDILTRSSSRHTLMTGAGSSLPCQSTVHNQSLKPAWHFMQIYEKQQMTNHEDQEK